jgi:ribosomal-protein-alanine N-acetyltransferase
MTNVRSMFRRPSARGRNDSNAPEVAAKPDVATVEIVPMRRRHLKAVIAIEQRIFPSPWSLGLYLSEISQPTSRAYYVARVGPDVVGYGGMMIVVGEAHVTNIGVAPEWQRHGVGRRLLLQLAQEARKRSAQHLTLEVRVTNVGAQSLYREFGFVPAGIRKNYYAEVNEDALVMWAHDIDADEYGLRLEQIEARLPPAEDQAPPAVPPAQTGDRQAPPADSR